MHSPSQKGLAEGRAPGTRFPQGSHRFLGWHSTTSAQPLCLAALPCARGALGCPSAPGSSGAGSEKAVEGSGWARSEMCCLGWAFRAWGAVVRLCLSPTASFSARPWPSTGLSWQSSSVTWLRYGRAWAGPRAAVGTGREMWACDVSHGPPGAWGAAVALGAPGLAVCGAVAVQTEGRDGAARR